MGVTRPVAVRLAKSWPNRYAETSLRMSARLSLPSSRRAISRTPISANLSAVANGRFVSPMPRASSRLNAPN
jgi:hypothetical protein